MWRQGYTWEEDRWSAQLLKTVDTFFLSSPIENMPPNGRLSTRRDFGDFVLVVPLLR